MDTLVGGLPTITSELGPVSPAASLVEPMTAALLDPDPSCGTRCTSSRLLDLFRRVSSFSYVRAVGFSGMQQHAQTWSQGKTSLSLLWDIVSDILSNLLSNLLFDVVLVHQEVNRWVSW